jgi:ubiquinone/menaquinone biosynthesis C-methylase UbiE
MPAAPDATAAHIKDVNTRYHDVAAASYDAKWGIDFGTIGREQVIGKLAKALGEPPAHYGDVLEIGAGTGYFGLNLVQAGLAERITATDISPGMLAALDANAQRLGIDARTVRTEAERLPFADESFDLVVGHAVLHHIPDLEGAVREFVRVLRPGGTIAFCGEPSAYGDRIAALPKRAGRAVAPLWRRMVGAGELRSGQHGDHAHDHGLEVEVDVHAFDPAELGRLFERAGAGSVRLRGEELLANMYGWGLRTVEASAQPEEIPNAWRQFAFRSYLLLQRIDTSLLEPRLPPALFYNLVLSARRPA